MFALVDGVARDAPRRMAESELAIVLVETRAGFNVMSASVDATLPSASSAIRVPAGDVPSAENVVTTESMSAEMLVDTLVAAAMSDTDAGAFAFMRICASDAVVISTRPGFDEAVFADTSDEIRPDASVVTVDDDFASVPVSAGVMRTDVIAIPAAPTLSTAIV